MSSQPDAPSIRATIDLVVGVLLLFVGIIGVASGLMISALADREAITRLVEEGILEAGGVDDAHLVELILGLLQWGGIGLAMAGGFILGGTAVFGVIRYRAHRRGRVEGSLYADGVVGAVITMLTSFIPFSPLIGGIAAGYLYRRGRWPGVRVGSVVGLLVAAPVIVVGAVLAVGYADAALLWASLIVVFLVVISTIVTVLLAGVGGYVGGYIQGDRGR